VSDSQALADRLGAGLYDLVVRQTSRISSSMQQIVLGAEGLSTFSYQAGQDVMVSVTNATGLKVRRRYTIRALDAAAGTLVLDVLLHGDGPGARWAAAAAPGDHVEAIAPRGKVTLNPGATWHLFVGDEAFAPAAFAMTEAHSPTSRSTILLEVDAQDDELQFSPPAASDRLHWVHRSSAAGPASPLLSALAELELAPEGMHAYLGGELRTVASLRSALMAIGFEARQLSPKPYWRSGSSNADHGEPERD
jgi:NADPH-dependent ferric siderophore reductase